MRTRLRYFVGPNAVNFTKDRHPEIPGQSVSAKLTYHFLKTARFTFGVRHFIPSSAPMPSHTWITRSRPHSGDSAPLARLQDRRQGDPSYNTPRTTVYRLWSQRFGAAVPRGSMMWARSGKPAASTYKPDKNDNTGKPVSRDDSPMGSAYTADGFYQMGQPEDIFEPAVRQFAGVQRQHRSIEGRRVESTVRWACRGWAYSVGSALSRR